MVYIDQKNPAAGGKFSKYIPIYGICQKYIYHILVYIIDIYQPQILNADPGWVHPQVAVLVYSKIH